MNLKNLGELDKLYNWQDIIILCEIFKQRSSHLLSSTEGDVIPQVILVVAPIGTKASVWLLYQQKLDMSGFLKKH